MQRTKARESGKSRNNPRLFTALLHTEYISTCNNISHLPIYGSFMWKFFVFVAKMFTIRAFYLRVCNILLNWWQGWFEVLQSNIVKYQQSMPLYSIWIALQRNTIIKLFMRLWFYAVDVPQFNPLDRFLFSTWAKEEKQMKWSTTK